MSSIDYSSTAYSFDQSGEADSSYQAAQPLEPEIWPRSWSFLSRYQEHIQIQDIPADEDVIKPGDPAEAFILVLNGWLRLATNPSKKNHHLDIGRGGFLGHEKLFSQQAHTSHVVARETSRIALIPASIFIQIFETHHQLHARTAFFSICKQLPSGFSLQMEETSTDFGMPSLFLLCKGGTDILRTWFYGDGNHYRLARVLQENDQHQTTEPHVLTFAAPERSTDRSVSLTDGRITDLTAWGTWPDLFRILDLMIHERALTPWQKALFRTQGELFLGGERDDLDTSVICKCLSLTRRDLREHVDGGCKTLNELACRSGASRVCGSCGPKLVTLLGDEGGWVPAEHLKLIDVNPTVKSLRIYPSNGVAMASQPGQHIVLRGFIDHDWVQRTYSLTNPPGVSDYYEITFKHLPDGQFSHWLFERAQSKSRLEVLQPSGDFMLDTQDESTEAVFFAGGIGVTPALSMIRALKGHASKRPFLLDYSVQKQEELIYPEELQDRSDDVAIRVHHRIAEQDGWLTPEQVAEVAKNHSQAEFYLCGPDGYQNVVMKGLEAAGIAQERIHVEQFVAVGTRRTGVRVSSPRVILGGSLAILGIGLVQALFPGLGAADSVQGFDLSQLWYDDLYKQISGYCLLTLTLLAASLGLRKRIRSIRFGQFTHWRLVHVLIGIALAAGIIAHTGLSMGQGASLMLSGGFLTAAGLGVFTGIATWWSRHKPGERSEQLQRSLNLVHLLALAPIPVLLGMHIVSVYYF